MQSSWSSWSSLRLTFWPVFLCCAACRNRVRIVTSVQVAKIKCEVGPVVRSRSAFTVPAGEVNCCLNQESFRMTFFLF